MKELIFNYENSLKDEDIKNSKNIFNDILKKLNETAKKNNYEDKFAFTNLPFNDTKEIIKLAKRYKNITSLVIIGIGGSNLGTLAIQQAVQGKFNQKNIKVHYADTLDPDTLKELLKTIESELKNNKKVLINCISKSGKTLETIANLEIFVNLLKKYQKNYNEYVVLTTERYNELWNFGLKNKFNLLGIPKNIGGRYSVFSNVGLFPLAVLGINIEELLKGARLIRNRCLNNLINNPIALSALSIYLSKKPIHNLYLLGNDLEGFGKWNNQLIAESLGKENNLEGTKINNGITPIITTISMDLHSLAQLYIAGPDDKISTFISYNFNNKIKIPELKYNLIEDIEGKEIGNIMDIILESVKNVYKSIKLKYTSIILNDKSEYSIGQLMQFKMMEMIFLGYLMNVNIFDQPNVEEYKNEIRKILKNERKN